MRGTPATAYPHDLSRPPAFFCRALCAVADRSESATGSGWRLTRGGWGGNRQQAAGLRSRALRMRIQGEPGSLHTPVQGAGSIPSHHRSVKAAIDLYNAGGDRGRPRLEFHIADHRWTGFYLRTDFPVPTRGRLLLNVEINATMLHERLSAPPTEAALYISKIAIAITIKVSTPATATPRQTSPITLSDWNSGCLLRTAFLPRHLNPSGSRGSRGIVPVPKHD